MLDFDLKIQTEKILLRPLIRDDLEKFYEITNDKLMWYYFTSDLSDKNDLEKWVNDSIIQRENKSRLAFTIVDKLSGKVIGSSSFGNISYHDKRIEIGWTWVSKEFQGKGFNPEMKYLMMKYCFEEMDFIRVEFKTDVLNIPARKALSKLGLTEEGILRSHTLMTNNRRRDTIYYSALKTEWEEIKLKNNWL